ncbi:MAG: hypothetical protein NT001_02670 [Candidatus Woesearchaeota archaeon]|nr:hypothetical protein [Candidatus Woesearchaeota archaeon]
MGADIIAEIQRGRKVGYSDKLIKKSLELSGYSSGSIKQAFKELEKRKNGNGNGVVFHTQSIKKANDAHNKPSAGKKPSQSSQPSQASPSEASEIMQEPIQPELQPALAQPIAAKKHKHWLKILIEIVLGILIFSVIGIMLYLYFLPAVSNTIV